MTPRTVRPIHYIAYGVTDILGAGSMAVVAGWILFFYSTFCGLSAVEATGIFAISRLLDAIWSPLVGHVSDHLGGTWLGRRFGRRRIILLCAIPFLPSFAFMWVGGHTYLYYLCTYVFFELVYATVLVPYGTLAPEMTDDFKKLSLFAGVRMLFAQASAILAGILPKLIIDTVGGKDSPDTFLYMGIIFSVLFMVVVFVTYVFSWEREGAAEVAAKAAKNTSFFDAFSKLYYNVGSTMRIRAFRLHLGMYLGGYISQDIFNAAFTYFVVFALSGSVAIASGMMGSMAFAQLVAVACFIPLILWIQPAPSYRLACGLYILGILGLIWLYHFQPANVALLLYVPVLISGLGRGGLNFIPWNIYNYIADVDEVVTGERREGIFAGVMIFVRKTTMAAAIMAVGLILDMGGFVTGATTQSPMARTTIVVLMAAGPILLLVMGILISLKFKLTKKTHAVLMHEIARFKQGDSTPPTPEDKGIIEDLTGWPYERLWGNNAVAHRAISAKSV
jgi:oligogalacturonide transporter